MKLLIASDIHGDYESAKSLIEIFEKEKCERILLLGDLLYHGPRNDLPANYAPKKVIELLNKNKDILLTVRGNCDTEVDQMVLDFPILADYIYLNIDSISMFATHGHIFNPENPPKLRRGELLLNGHTHIYRIEKFGDDNIYINPGSISIPKVANPQTYAIYENKKFTVKDICGNELKSIEIK